jgi:hypothetical protein
VPNSDFYDLAETLNAEELSLVKHVRTFMEKKVEDMANELGREVRLNLPPRLDVHHPEVGFSETRDRICSFPRMSNKRPPILLGGFGGRL